MDDAEDNSDSTCLQLKCAKHSLNIAMCHPSASTSTSPTARAGHTSIHLSVHPSSDTQTGIPGFHMIQKQSTRG
eukprot:356262-Chlamydomonas_euryale.AAC.5